MKCLNLFKVILINYSKYIMFFILSTISIALLINVFFDIKFSCKFKKNDIIDSDSSEDNNNDNSSDTDEEVVEEESEECEDCDDEECECNILPELIPLSSANKCDDIYKCDEKCVCYNLEQQPEQQTEQEQAEQAEQEEQESEQKPVSTLEKIVEVDGMTIGY